MGWNYRVVCDTKEHSKLDMRCYNIHEVYYTIDGTIQSWTESPVCPTGKSLDELRIDVANYLKAFDKPIIDIVEGRAEERKVLV